MRDLMLLGTAKQLQNYRGSEPRGRRAAAEAWPTARLTDASARVCLRGPL